MSEYWKSTPKYWCKHCSIYVKDTPLERRTHESTGKHQGNLKRFLRDIQNNHEKGEREKERAKAEVERLNKVVGSNASTSSSVTNSTSNNTKTASAHTTSVRKTPAAPLTAADQKRQWTQLAEMGIQVPDDYRAELAMVGDWKVVSQPKPEQDLASGDSLSVGVRKRKLNEEPHDPDDLDAAELPSEKRIWGKSLRHYPGQTSANDDLDDLLSGNTLKREKSEPAMKQEPGIALDDAIESSDTRSIHQRLEASGELAQPSDEPVPVPLVKTEQNPPFGEYNPESQVAVSAPAKDEAPAPVFKKRKSKAAPP